ncbi:hypothetical protein GQ472_05110 [archaeon]|nr:hypothetical protein [archaeon]
MYPYYRFCRHSDKKLTDCSESGQINWNIETGSNNIIIAIVDTGIDFDHPDLDSKTWNNTAEIPGNSSYLITQS